MAATPSYSIRRKFLFVILSIVSASFILTTFIISNEVLKYSEQHIVDDIIQRTNLLAKRSKPFINNRQHEALNEVLTSLTNIPRFNYVHIYRVTQDDELDFFTSYAKGGARAILSKVDEIDQLVKPRFSDNYVEYISPINTDGEITGYIYVQLSTDSYTRLLKKITLILLAGFIFFVLISVFAASRLHKYILNPITELISTLQTVSQKRNYQLRSTVLPYQEFDVLGRNLNTMLARTEKYIQNQDDAEQEILKLNHELEDKVNQRTEALKESNQELLSTLEKLHQFQGQLVESEKMASLGDMVAGVAHEVNTPIGLGVTASTLLGDRLKEIQQAFENKTLKSSQLKRFLSESSENVGIVYRNLNRAADLISNFKKVAVDQSSEQDRLINVKELIDEVLFTLAPQLKHKPVDIRVDCPNDLEVISKPGPLHQIFTNLIVNSLIHGFEEMDSGVIQINIMLLSGQLHCNYKDNGKGVAPALKHKIFDPFITTKRGEGGSGLGLHLVYNLVTQALGGNIVFDTELTSGVIFDINFPVDLQQNHNN